jgi:uncharacterized protein (DUF849 family)
MGTADKAIVTCALTGAVTTKKQCAAIPYSADEIGEEAKRAWEAGAAVVHVHGREDSGQPSYRPEVFVAYKKAIEARCPVIINFSTGAVGLSKEERIAHVLQTRPSIGALNMGSMNYAKYSRSRKSFVFNMVFPNPFEEIIELLRAMNELGIKPEHECFDIGHVGSLEPLIDMGVLEPPLHVDCIMGVVGGIPAGARNLAAMVANIPGVGGQGGSKSHWGVIGISREQWLLVAAALTLGGSVRVGLEDNLYLPNGEMARSNGELIAKARQMAEDVGRRPATVQEARGLLNVPQRDG